MHQYHYAATVMRTIEETKTLQKNIVPLLRF